MPNFTQIGRRIRQRRVDKLTYILNYHCHWSDFGETHSTTFVRFLYQILQKRDGRTDGVVIAFSSY